METGSQDKQDQHLVHEANKNIERLDKLIADLIHKRAASVNTRTLALERLEEDQDLPPISDGAVRRASGGFIDNKAARKIMEFIQKHTQN